MTQKMNWPMPVVILLTAAGLSFSFYRILTPEVYVSSSSAPISYYVLPDEDGRADKAHVLQGMFWSPQGREITVSLLYRSGGDSSFEEIAMERVRGTKVFVGSLPGRVKGERTFYYLRARDSQRNEVMIPPGAPGKPLLYVTFEDPPWKPAIIAHIVLTLGALLMFAHAFYYALRILGGCALKKETGRCFSNALAGWATFAVSTLPLGFYVSHATFGQWWSGWPVGPDITDTKSALLAIYWAIPVAMFWREKIEERSLSWLVVIGSLLTAVVYLIPHSYFYQ